MNDTGAGAITTAVSSFQCYLSRVCCKAQSKEEKDEGEWMEPIKKRKKKKTQKKNHWTTLREHVVKEKNQNHVRWNFVLEATPNLQGLDAVDVSNMISSDDSMLLEARESIRLGAKGDAGSWSSFSDSERGGSKGGEGENEDDREARTAAEDGTSSLWNSFTESEDSRSKGRKDESDISNNTPAARKDAIV